MIRKIAGKTVPTPIKDFSYKDHQQKRHSRSPIKNLFRKLFIKKTLECISNRQTERKKNKNLWLKKQWKLQSIIRKTRTTRCTKQIPQHRRRTHWNTLSVPETITWSIIRLPLPNSQPYMDQKQHSKILEISHSSTNIQTWER